MNRLLMKLQFMILTWAQKEDGQNLVEYALVVALVAFGATTAMRTLGTGLNHAFSQISSTLSSSLT